MPEVSVIIPTYNCAQYITEAIESVLNQTYKDFEIIVVDDGSTDNTKQVLAPYIEKNLISYIYQVNQGPGAARNTGIKAAKGDYIAFLDSDDILTEDSLEKRLNLIDNFPDVDFVFSDWFSYEQESQKVTAFKKEGFLKKFMKISDNTSQGIIFKNKSFEEIFEIPFYIWTVTVLLKKRIFKTVGLFRTDIFRGEDRDMWLRIAKRHKIGYVNLPLAYYMRFRSNLTAINPIRYGEERINFYHDLLKIYGREKSICKIISRRMAFIYNDVGFYYYRNNQTILAIKNFIKSICHNPWYSLSYKFLLSCLIPKKLRKTLKKLRTSNNIAQ